MRDDLTAWVSDTAPRALAYAVSLVRNVATAEELVQDCYQRLLARSDQYDLPRDGASLLFRAITNACINWTQREPAHVGLDAVRSVAAHRGPAPVESLLLDELQATVDSALAELPLDQRAAIQLYALGHSSADVAEILETTPGNVRVLLHRGRQQLAKRLRPYLEE